MVQYQRDPQDDKENPISREEREVSRIEGRTSWGAVGPCPV